MEAENQDNQGQANPGNVGGLIAEVENKMSELMAWHKNQVAKFEDDKAKFEAEMNLQREALKAEGEQQAQSLKEQAEQQAQAIASQRSKLDDQLTQVEDQRVKLAALANKLRAEESAMSREWGEVQRERETLQKQSAEVAKLREEVQERAKAWLDTTAAKLSEPLKLTTEQEPQAEHHGEHHHAA